MHLKISFIWLLIVAGNWHMSDSAKILFFFTGGTYSHDISIWPLVVRLADRQHEVTFYSAHTKKPWRDERIKVVTPSRIEEINTGYLSDTFTMRLENREVDIWKSIPDWSFEICKYILTDTGKPESDMLFNSGKFDLVILDSILCDCGHIIGYFHNAKVIVSDSTSVLPWYHYIYGFPSESDWLPAATAYFHHPMSLLNVIENYFELFYYTHLRRTYFYPKLDGLMKQFFKEKVTPTFLELERRAQLIFVNTHASIELPRSLPPNVIQIGGMQMWGQKNATIPEDINQFIEKAEQGLILLAFGSSIDFSSIPSRIEAIFFEAFKRFPKINFLVKASDTKPEHGPNNLRYENWIPQKEILANSKTIACITHGGLNGIIENTFLGVPLITIPIFGEQDYQSYKLQVREVGIRLELRDLTVQDLSDAISNITTDQKYRENMKTLQAAFRDRPETPLDLATYWTEYVLRHHDMSFMNPITYQPRWVYIEQYVFSTFYSLLIAVSLSVIVTFISVRV